MKTLFLLTLILTPLLGVAGPYVNGTIPIPVVITKPNPPSQTEAPNVREPSAQAQGTEFKTTKEIYGAASFEQQERDKQKAQQEAAEFAASQLTLKHFFDLLENDSEENMDRLKCTPPKGLYRKRTPEEIAKLKNRLKLRIEYAGEVERMHFDLANEATRTSSWGKVGPSTVVGIPLALLVAGIQLSSLTSIFGYVILVPVVYFEKFLISNIFRNYIALINPTSDSEEKALLMVRVVKRLQQLNCDVSELHKDIASKRQEVMAQFDDPDYVYKNGFGSRSANLTLQLYSLAFLDRLVYQMELSELK